MRGGGQSGSRGGDRKGIEDGDAGKAGEVGDVESEQVPEAMGAHRGDDSGVVGDFTFAIVGDNERPPFGEEIGRVIEEGEGRQIGGEFDGDGDGSQSEAVVRHGAGGDHPKFVKALRHSVEGVPLETQSGHGRQGDGMLFGCDFDQAK